MVLAVMPMSGEQPMSVEAFKRVYPAIGHLGLAEWKVATFLAWRLDDRMPSGKRIGWSHAYIDTSKSGIARDTGLDRTTVYRAMRKLVLSLGFYRIEKRPFRRGQVNLSPLRVWHRPEAIAAFIAAADAGMTVDELADALADAEGREASWDAYKTA